MSDKKETSLNGIELNVDNGGLSTEQLSALKHTHGRIHEITVDDEEAGIRLKGYFKRPDMNTMQAVSSVSKRNEVQGGEILFDNCWLGGAQLLKNDAVYKMEGIAALSGLFGKCKHELKNW
nr:MAG TPA: hypothetical protein [Caudoviricetes sp.]